MPSWNEDLQEEVYITPILMIHMTLDMYVSLRKGYMVSNKHLVLGLRNFLLWSLLLDLFPIVTILLFFVKYTDASYIIMSLCVDDMIITSDDISCVLR